MKYWIFEDNMERLNKKLTKIGNKCKRYGCEFHYQVIGSEYRKSGIDVLKFIQVDVSGTAKINGWQLVAKIEHHKPVNVVMQLSDIKVPEKYWTTDSTCEHCNTKKARKHTYLVYNESTGQYKQVGKSCLKDFTNGLSSEMAAGYVSMFDELIKGEAVVGKCTNHYHQAIDVLRYSVAAIKAFGFAKSKLDDGSTNWDSTTCKVSCFMLDENTYAEYQKKGMDANADGVQEEAEAVLNWIKDQPMDYGYISNLKAATESGYVEAKHVSLVVSAVHAYHNAIEKAKALDDAKVDSEWIGQEGKRVELDIASCKVVTSWYNDYGLVNPYQFITTDNQVCPWKTTKGIDVEKIKKIRATIKGHNEYKGTKQTELTRCSVIG